MCRLQDNRQIVFTRISFSLADGGVRVRGSGGPGCGDDETLELQSLFQCAVTVHVAVFTELGFGFLWQKRLHVYCGLGLVKT